MYHLYCYYSQRWNLHCSISNFGRCPLCSGYPSSACSGGVLVFIVWIRLLAFDSKTSLLYPDELSMNKILTCLRYM